MFLIVCELPFANEGECGRIPFYENYYNKKFHHFSEDGEKNIQIG